MVLYLELVSSSNLLVAGIVVSGIKTKTLCPTSKFEIGQKVLVLIPDTTSSKTFSKWVGPAVIKDRLSNHTYSVEINKYIHADKIRKYNIQIDEATCDTVTTDHEHTKINHCAIIYDEDSDFGSVDVIDTDQF